MNHLQAFKNDLLGGREYEVPKFRFELLPWWYNLFALLCVMILLLITAGYAVALITTPGSRVDLLRLPAVMQINLALFYLLSIWMIVSVITGWCSWKYAMDSILACSICSIAFMMYMLAGTILRNAKVNKYVFLWAVLPYAVFTWRAFRIREDWKSRQRKPALSENQEAGLSHPATVQADAKARKALLTSKIQVLMAVLAVLSSVMITILIFALKDWNHTDSGDIIAWVFMLPLIVLLLIQTAGIISLWYGWKRAVTLTKLVSIVLAGIWFAATGVCLSDDNNIWNAAFFLPLFLLQAWFVVQLYSIKKKWKGRS